eukprot:1555343-Heterocapsa_arctica.AAC.1
MDASPRAWMQWKDRPTPHCSPILQRSDALAHAVGPFASSSMVVSSCAWIVSVTGSNCARKNRTEAQNTL